MSKLMLPYFLYSSAKSIGIIVRAYAYSYIFVAVAVNMFSVDSALIGFSLFALSCVINKCAHYTEDKYPDISDAEDLKKFPKDLVVFIEPLRVCTGYFCIYLLMVLPGLLVITLPSGGLEIVQDWFHGDNMTTAAFLALPAPLTQNMYLYLYSCLEGEAIERATSIITYISAREIAYTFFMIFINLYVYSAFTFFAERRRAYTRHAVKEVVGDSINKISSK